jgi:hypothetical protein
MSRTGADIDANVAAYLRNRGGDARYSSFDYCFNYFRSFKDAGRNESLVAAEHLEMSCLQLGFYLASWGMFRGKADLLKHSARRLVPVIEMIASAPDAIWDVDADDYGADVQALVFEVASDLRRVLPGGQSSTLVTKTMLGVFGCVPAFDRFFRLGFEVSTFGPKALRAIDDYYRTHAETINRHRVATLDFATGESTGLSYTASKVIDMVFFVEGAGPPRSGQ